MCSAAGDLVFHVFGAIAHFKRRPIVERTQDRIAAARGRGERPGRPPLNEAKLQAALTLVRSRLSPRLAAHQVGLG
jgi:DNA invertase Pin-like site-specific DNA recombinase